MSDKNAHASRVRQLQTSEREAGKLREELGAAKASTLTLTDALEAATRRNAEIAGQGERERASLQAQAAAQGAALAARIACLEASNAISKAAILSAAPARERAVAEARQRLEADHAKRSSLARTILAEKDSKVELLRKRVGELETELASGGHAHKKIVEIAERQARREGALSSEAAQATRAVRDRDGEVADLASQLLGCQKKLDDARRGLGRDSTNLEYVKNLLVQYFSLRQNSSEQASLVPVLATVLAFTADDLALLRAQAQKWEASLSYWGQSEPDAPNPLLSLTTLAPAPRHASPTNT